jgi:hypothetical protein
MAEFLARPLGNRGGPVMESDAPSNTADAFGKRANHHPPPSSLRMSTDALPRRKTRFSTLTVWYPYHASTICLYATAERWPALLLMVLAAPPVSGGSPTGLSAFSSTFGLQQRKAHLSQLDVRHTLLQPRSRQSRYPLGIYTLARTRCRQLSAAWLNVVTETRCYQCSSL